MRVMANGSDDLDQFLVAARSSDAASDLAAFEQALQAVPGASVLTRAGRPDQPRLVVAMTSDAFEQLRARFGATLIMERNAPLTPLSP
jgi:hypothetical protein